MGITRKKNFFFFLNQVFWLEKLPLQIQRCPREFHWLLRSENKETKLEERFKKKKKKIQKNQCTLSPWYNCNGSLGTKHQVTYSLSHFQLFHWAFHSVLHWNSEQVPLWANMMVIFEERLRIHWAFRELAFMISFQPINTCTMHKSMKAQLPTTPVQTIRGCTFRRSSSTDWWDRTTSWKGSRVKVDGRQRRR